MNKKNVKIATFLIVATFISVIVSFSFMGRDNREAKHPLSEIGEVLDITSDVVVEKLDNVMEKTDKMKENFKGSYKHWFVNEEEA